MFTDLAVLFLVILSYFYFKPFSRISYLSSVGASGPGAPRALKSARCGRIYMLCYNVYMSITPWCIHQGPFFYISIMNVFFLLRPLFSKPQLGLHFPSQEVGNFYIILLVEDTPSWHRATAAIKARWFESLMEFLRNIYKIFIWEIVFLNLHCIRQRLWYVTFPESVINKTEASSIPRGWRVYY